MAARGTMTKALRGAAALLTVSLPATVSACAPPDAGQRAVSESLIIRHVRAAYLDAKTAFGNPPDQRLRLLSWPQTWPDTGLGSGQPGLQAITRAQTVVAIHGSRARVYHGGRFAYEARADDPGIVRGIREHRLPGKAAWNGGNPGRDSD